MGDAYPGTLMSGKIERAFHLSSDILPALLAVNGNKKVYRLLRSAFDEPSITSFLSDMMAGRGRNFQYTFDPLLDPAPKKPKEEPVVREEL